MLNNPPEDAPRKPGVFPKTCKKKAIPFDAVQDTQGNVPVMFKGTFYFFYKISN